VAVTTLPWSNYTGHAHWDNIRWVPFSDRFLISVDVALNVVLFVPFGFLSVPAGSVATLGRRVPLIIVSAGALSVCAELYQVYCHNRVPSTTDVCTNVLGAVLGVLFRWRSGTGARDALFFVNANRPGDR
jgi:glycopeptide antibiotics resistance protein